MASRCCASTRPCAQDRDGTEQMRCSIARRAHLLPVCIVDRGYDPADDPEFRSSVQEVASQLCKEDNVNPVTSLDSLNNYIQTRDEPESTRDLTQHAEVEVRDGTEGAAEQQHDFVPRHFLLLVFLGPRPQRSRCPILQSSSLRLRQAFPVQRSHPPESKTREQTARIRVLTFYARGCGACGRLYEYTSGVRSNSYND